MKIELVERYYALDKELYELSKEEPSLEKDLKKRQLESKRGVVLEALTKDYGVQVRLGDLFEKDGTPIISWEDK